MLVSTARPAATLRYSSRSRSSSTELANLKIGLGSEKPAASLRNIRGGLSGDLAQRVRCRHHQAANDYAHSLAAPAIAARGRRQPPRLPGHERGAGENRVRLPRSGGQDRDV